MSLLRLATAAMAGASVSVEWSELSDFFAAASAKDQDQLLKDWCTAHGLRATFLHRDVGGTITRFVSIEPAMPSQDAPVAGQDDASLRQAVARAREGHPQTIQWNTVAALFPATSVDKQRKAFLAWCARRGIDATFSWTPGDDGALMTFVVLRSQRRAGRHIGR